jgi:putative ABC transport system permease protein
LQVSVSVEYGSANTKKAITASTADYFAVRGRTVASGRLFDENDVKSSGRVAVIGQTTVTNLFSENVSPLGETIKLNGVSFKVIGTLEKFGGSSFGADQDDIIVIPLTAARSHLQTTRNVSGQLPVSQIYIQAVDGNNVDAIVDNATKLLRQEHKIKPGKTDDFYVSSQKDLVGSLNAVIGVLTAFLGIIGGISLLVGGIGVMNIMLVTVTERTREIGLRKAVGARGWDVMLQFLTEATFLCFVGATAGLIVSFLFTVILGIAVPDLRPSITLPSLVLGIGVTTFIGIFFGLYPASRAAALSPIQALRSE